MLLRYIKIRLNRLLLGITVSDLTGKLKEKAKVNGKIYEKYILDIEGEEWKTLDKFEETITVSNKGRIDDDEEDTEHIRFFLRINF